MLKVRGEREERREDFTYDLPLNCHSLFPPAKIQHVEQTTKQGGEETGVSPSVSSRVENIQQVRYFMQQPVSVLATPGVYDACVS